jgi:hypothetical protein
VRAALVLGIAASIAANVLHAEPNTVARLIAAWPPAALLITLELIARVPVHRRSLAAVRFVATTTIGGIAAWVSYWHMAAVAQRYGETGAAPYLIPISVDGLVVVASVCLVELAGRLRDVESAHAETGTEATKAAAPAEPSPQVTATESTDQSGSAAEPAEDGGIEAVDHRAAAVAALLLPDADPAAIAADAGVRVETLQRWADRAASRSRRPRGGARKPAAVEPAGINGAEVPQLIGKTEE